MSELNLVKIPECPNFIEKATSPAAIEIGQTFGNIFYYIFSPINFNVEKLRIKHNENLKKFQFDLQEKLGLIPEDRLIEPKLSIVGPALEASKFYIDETEIRKMFAQLIASSMNSDNADSTHISFVEIIKQLSKVDALLFQEFYNKRNAGIVKYRFVENSFVIGLKGASPGFDIATNLIKTDLIDIDHYKLIPASIDNLTRLGLITVSYETSFKNKDLYKEIHSIFEDEINDYIIEEKKKPKYTSYQLETIEGLLSITNFGYNFGTICL